MLENTYKEKVLTVSQLTAAIKNLLEKNLNFIALKGEISNFKYQSSGHMYFSLKDNYSQISAVLFKGYAQNLNQLPKDGDQVIVEASLSVYPPRGNYQLIVKKISFIGMGDLFFKLHELKEKLQKRGWFDKIHKKELPLLPKKIGIVTSPTGSVIQDILNVLKRRFSNFHLILNPVKVQGTDAAIEIAKAIDEFNKYNLVDVIIIGRGGGSLEDLWAFNEEIVAKSIFESKIPIISAVGHETDVSISDFVADIRAPTPSAAAEIVIKEKMQFLDTLNYFKDQISKQISFQIKHLELSLNRFNTHPVFSSAYAILGKQLQMLDDIKNLSSLFIRQKIHKQKEFLELLSSQTKSLNPSNRLKDLKKQLYTFEDRISLFIKNFLSIKKERLKNLISHLKTTDPKNLLKKGYSILFSEKDSSIILSINDIAENEKFTALLSDGKIKATVEKKNE